MTVRRFGKVMPLQLYMLSLGGEIVSWGGRTPPTDRDRLKLMKEGRGLLKMLTKRDFGYDLTAWHHFLLNHAELSKEYKYQSTWKAIRLRIEELLDDPDRLRLVRLLEKEHSDADADNRSGA